MIRRTIPAFKLQANTPVVGEPRPRDEPCWPWYLDVQKHSTRPVRDVKRVYHLKETMDLVVPELRRSTPDAAERIQIGRCEVDMKTENRDIN